MIVDSVIQMDPEIIWINVWRLEKWICQEQHFAVL